MYAIKINKSGRYILWVNDCWYETRKEPSYLYTREECDKAFELLRKHYVYAITIIDEDGHQEELNRFANKSLILTKNGLPKLVTKSPKKSLFKVNASLLNKK